MIAWQDREAVLRLLVDASSAAWPGRAIEFRGRIYSLPAQGVRKMKTYSKNPEAVSLLTPE
jgi:hypothetical protein